MRIPPIESIDFETRAAFGKRESAVGSTTLGTTTPKPIGFRNRLRVDKALRDLRLNEHLRRENSLRMDTDVRDGPVIYDEGHIGAEGRGLCLGDTYLAASALIPKRA